MVKSFGEVRKETAAGGAKLKESMEALTEKKQLEELEEFAKNLDSQIAEITVELKEYWGSKCATSGIEEPKWVA
jgi:hypothetical protein